MTTLGPETVKTYRYVRISLIAGVALLFCALAVHITSSGAPIEASISAYFYLPVRSVFVGTLVGASLALIAIHGRPGGEDALLNLAGMLFLLVAFIPTPIPGLPGAPCPRRESCVPEQFVAVAVINAKRSDDGVEVAGRRASYTALYGLVALLMGLGMAAALAYWWVALRPAPDAESTVVFWLEAWLLLLFAVFWAFQTKEFWHEGLPRDAVRDA